MPTHTSIHRAPFANIYKMIVLHSSAVDLECVNDLTLLITVSHFFLRAGTLIVFWMHNVDKPFWQK